jgi:large subunit ribosomal protein L29
MKSEFKDKTADELKVHLGKLRRSQFKMRLVKASGEEGVQTHKIRELRRDIARIETRLTQLKEGKQS